MVPRQSGKLASVRPLGANRCDIAKIGTKDDSEEEEVFPPLKFPTAKPRRKAKYAPDDGNDDEK